MTLFVHNDVLSLRKTQIRNPIALGGLAQSLQRELHAALDVPIPDGKARMTRFGGRCATCTVLLSFDARQPHAHACPSCGRVVHDALHHQWWLMNAHLWTAEQCTRAAALAYLLDDVAAGERADDILSTYADRYLHWPNRDNVLGPTRPFFSTYLESIWLLHLATALDLRARSNFANSAAYGRILSELVEPSAALIASYPEGRSNREVWHCAALLAAAGVLNDTAMRSRAVLSLITLLRDGLHSDGSWYEGENYHLFAHRGLLTAVTIAEQTGVELPAELVTRFDAGFLAPFRTMLPDGTFPARRDSQYGVTLRQYRTADWAECGLARKDSPELRAALATLYATWPEVGDTARWCSTADAERNGPSVRLTRADCSWRALLLAPIDMPPIAGAVANSELLEGQGLAVFRRKSANLWVGLDYGDPGAGHGHPDRLNLVIATPDARWLDDVGTGSYTSPTLAWYRSSAAHNAPMVNGHDQGAARGALLAYDERDGMGWVQAVFVDPISAVRLVRSVVIMNDHIVDELQWTSELPVTIDLPMQAKILTTTLDPWTAFDPHVDAHGMLSHAMMTPLIADTPASLTLVGLPSPAQRDALQSAPMFECAIVSSTNALLWRADTLGPPGGDPHGMLSLRQSGLNGRSIRVFSARGDIAAVTYAGAAVQVRNVAGAVFQHARTERGWTIVVDGIAGRNVVELAGARELDPIVRAPSVITPRDARALPLGASYRVECAGSAYRTTEETWIEAGEPTAVVSVAHTNSQHIEVTVTASLNRSPHFAPDNEPNPLDNELADVNSDGVQLHWSSAVTGNWNSALAVPDGDTVRLTNVAGTLDGLAASWSSVADGFTVTFSLPWPAALPQFSMDLCVNEQPAARERRRGQLVLSGARGESAYLRGARQSDAHALLFDLSPVLL